LFLESWRCISILTAKEVAMPEHDPACHQESESVEDLEFLVLDGLAWLDEYLLEVTSHREAVDYQGPLLLLGLNGFLIRAPFLDGFNHLALRLDVTYSASFNEITEDGEANEEEDCKKHGPEKERVLRKNFPLVYGKIVLRH
jgi:hypothetical protein